MLRNRVSVSAAEFVCSVDSTKWPRLGRLHGGLGPFPDRVSRLPSRRPGPAQKSPQRSREIQTHLAVHLHLVDAVDMDLHRILDGGDVAMLCVQHIQASVQGDGFCRCR